MGKMSSFFRNGSVHEFYHLKALITLELNWLNTSPPISGRKKKRIFMSKTSMVRLTVQVLKTFIVCKLSLVISMRIIFGDD